METSSPSAPVDQREDAWEAGQALAVLTHPGALWGKQQMVALPLHSQGRDLKLVVRRQRNWEKKVKYKQR